MLTSNLDLHAMKTNIFKCNFHLTKPPTLPNIENTHSTIQHIILFTISQIYTPIHNPQSTNRKILAPISECNSTSIRMASSDFAQKLLHDLRLRKERMANAQSSGKVIFNLNELQPMHYVQSLALLQHLDLLTHSMLLTLLFSSENNMFFRTKWCK